MITLEKGENMDVILNIIYGWLGLFAQPLFYLFLLFALWVGARRVRLERRDFHVRVNGVAQGLVTSIVPGLLMGLFASIVWVAMGIVLAPGMLVLIAALYVLAMLTFQLRFVTPAFAVAAAVLVAYFSPSGSSGVELLDTWIADIQDTSLLAVTMMLGTLLIIEGVLVRIWGRKETTPRLLRGRRGKQVGLHEARKFWLVPICLLLPTGAIPALDGWPLTVGVGGSFSLLLVPFGFGFYRRMTEASFKQSTARAASGSFYVGILVIIIAVLGWARGLDSLAPMAAGGAIVLRIVWMIWDRGQQKRHTPGYFLQQNDGLAVLGVLPGSPAEKMGIAIGERIQKVNGLNVSTEEDFYKALQKNAAYCRMEVADLAGEVRFVKGALYEGGHHELGLLFVTSPQTAL